MGWDYLSLAAGGRTSMHPKLDQQARRDERGGVYAERRYWAPKRATMRPPIAEPATTTTWTVVALTAMASG